MNVKASEGPIQCVAAKALIVRDGKVLVLKQSADPTVDGANRYHPPGGIVEPGEHLRDTLLREVREETGLAVTVGAVFAVEEWRVTIRGEACQFFGVFFTCKLKGTDEVALQAEEASSYAWVDKDNLDDYEILEPSLGVIRRLVGAKT